MDKDICFHCELHQIIQSHLEDGTEDVPSIIGQLEQVKFEILSSINEEDDSETITE